MIRLIRQMGAGVCLRNADPSWFPLFHDLLKQERAEQLYDSNVFVLAQLFEWKGGSSARIADCGCGMEGWIPLLQTYHHLTLPFTCTVDGYDLSEDIRSRSPNPLPGITFTPIVNDWRMMKNEYDILICNQSMWEERWESYFHFANAHLPMGGWLIFSVETPRAVGEMESMMEEYGFRVLREYEQTYWHSVLCEKVGVYVCKPEGCDCS